MHYPLGEIKETAVSPWLEFARKLSCLCKLARTFFAVKAALAKRTGARSKQSYPTEKWFQQKRGMSVCMSFL